MNWTRKLKYSLFTVLFILLSCGDVENGVDEINQSILTNGIVKVEMAKQIEDPWYQLPYIFYEEENVSTHTYDAFYTYTNGEVRVEWNCSFG